MEKTATPNYEARLPMENDTNHESLNLWNNLSKSNTENAILNTMFDGVLTTSEPMETFCTWLLVASGAIASYILANAEKLIPILSKAGFMTCGTFLFLSCSFGLLSKLFFLRCKSGIETARIIKEKATKHFQDYDVEKSQIEEIAKSSGVQIDSEIRLEKIQDDFLCHFPPWIQWLSKRQMTTSKPPYGILIKSLVAQGSSLVIQTMCFLGFLATGFIFATTI